jgi:hypothetical protein
MLDSLAAAASTPLKECLSADGGIRRSRIETYLKTSTLPDLTLYTLGLLEEVAMKNHANYSECVT